MAFTQLTAGIANPTQVKDAIYNFALANGWADAGGSVAGEDWIQKTGAQAGVGNMAIGIRQIPGSNNLEFKAATSYDSGLAVNNFRDQPTGVVAYNGAFTGGPNSGIQQMDMSDDPGPYTSLCLFSNAAGDPCYIYAALEFAPGRFAHAQFGEFTKYDNGTPWTGGWFLETSNQTANYTNPISINNIEGTQNLALLNNRTQHFRFNFETGAYYAQVPSNVQAWGRRGCATSATGAVGNPYYVMVGGTSFQPHTYINGSNEAIAGAFPYAAPIPIFMELNPNTAGQADQPLVPLGEFSDMYLGPINTVTPKVTKEFGGVDYMPLPLSSASAAATPNSGDAGIFIKINP